MRTSSPQNRPAASTHSETAGQVAVDLINKPPPAGNTIANQFEKRYSKGNPTGGNL